MNVEIQIFFFNRLPLLFWTGFSHDLSNIQLKLRRYKMEDYMLTLYQLLFNYEFMTCVSHKVSESVSSI